VDTNDNNWFLSSLEGTNYTLPDDGRIALKSFGGFDIFKITRPRSVPLKQIDTDPRYILDMILQNIRTDRSLTQYDKYRILSYGDPMEVTEYRDALGRSWIAAAWLIGFDDSVKLLYILPMPNGPVVISTTPPSSRRQEYEWDLRKLCDHIQVAYSAAFEGWDEFLALNPHIPDFLGDFKFGWNPDAQEVSLEAGTVSVSAGKDVFEWTPLSELFIAPFWYRTADQGPVEFGLRWIYLSRDSRNREYINLYKNIKPDPRLGSSSAENWGDLVRAKYPYNEQPAISVKDNTGSVGAILQTDLPKVDVLYTLYLSMEDPRDEENLSRRFNAIKAGIRLINNN
jgi:hypothetical protein